MKVEVSVEEFSAGNEDCNKAYALISSNGSSYDSSNTQRLCGTETIRNISVLNEMNVLFNGKYSAQPRFTASYKVL
jgi:hypothetical protein